MKIKWYGHSAFRLTTMDGVSIIIDPYEPGGLGGVIGYDPINRCSGCRAHHPRS